MVPWLARGEADSQPWQGKGAKESKMRNSEKRRRADGVVNGLMRDGGREPAQPANWACAEREGREGLSGQGPAKQGRAEGSGYDGTSHMQSRRGDGVEHALVLCLEAKEFSWLDLSTPATLACKFAPFHLQVPACPSIHVVQSNVHR